MLTPNNYWAHGLLIFGSMMTISSNTWLGGWVGLEVNMVSFIILAMNKTNNYNTECVVKYFLIQSISSLMIMAQIFSDFKGLSLTLMITIPLMIKLGMFPFYYWVLDVNSNIKSYTSFILLTWQKLAPLSLLSNFMASAFIILILLSGILTSFIGLNYVLPSKILAISSVYHISWMVSALLLGGMIMGVYFTIYSITLLMVILYFIMSYTHMNVNILILSKHTLLMNILMLSFMGLPPFLGFPMKWVVLMSLLTMKLIYLSTTLALTSLFNIFMYSRLIYYSLIIKKMSWNKGSSYFKLNYYLVAASLAMPCAMPMIFY